MFPKHKWASLFSASKEDMDNLRVVNSRLCVICSVEWMGSLRPLEGGTMPPNWGLWQPGIHFSYSPFISPHSLSNRNFPQHHEECHCQLC